MESFTNYYHNPSSSGSSSAPNHINRKEKKKSGGKKSSSGIGGGGVKLSTDPQSVAARERRHRISDRFKILQSLVPGGTKMDTVSMLEGAIHYVKYLKMQIWIHQTMINFVPHDYDDDHLHHEYYSSSIPLDTMIVPTTLSNSKNDLSDVADDQQHYLPPLPLAEDMTMYYDAYNVNEF